MYAHSGQKSLTRVVSYLLALCVVLSCLPVYTHSTSPVEQTESTAEQTEIQETQDTFFEQVKLYADGVESAYEELTWDSHLTLSAKYEGGNENVDVFTWQIYDPAGCCWVAINSANAAELKVGAALLASMTNENGTAILNCKITADGALYYSDAIQIRLMSGEEEAAPVAEVKAARSNVSARMEPVTTSDGEISGGELITYTVRVEYYNYITQKEAAKPYIATVKPDTTDLTVFPDSPTVVGFTPYIITKDGIKGADPLTAADANATVVYEYTDSDGVLQKIYGIETHKLKLDLSNVTEDKTYQIVYMPNKVYYTVSHYVQNIVNDDYVLYYVETKQGYVGQMTDATNLTLAHPTDPSAAAPLAQGFTALVPFKNQIIAADGTTQINTYYDRLYFLVTYKLDGGRGADPVYARYGASIHNVDPVKTGYTFAGWVKIQMEDATATASSPRPKVDKNGQYIPLYTDANGEVQMNGTEFIHLTQDSNGTYYGPDNTPYTLLTSDKLLKTMPAFHTAMMAVWEKADTEYTVVYWLENADYQITAENPEIKYDYWCAVTRDAETGYNLSQIYAELENPRLPSAGYQPDSFYVRKTEIDLNSLDKQSFALVSNNEFITLLTDSSSDGQGLKGGTFDSSVKTVEWTFEWVDQNTYKLRSGNKYLRMDGNNLYHDAEESNATSFKLGTQANYANCITFQKVGTNSYIDRYDPNKIAAWDHSGDYESNSNIGFQLYTYFTPEYVPPANGTGAAAITTSNDEKINDPDIDYYYYYYSDFREPDSNTVNDITVSSDGKTTVNVYFRRREYNLRFFYARSYMKNGTKQYQVIGGSSYGFSRFEESTTQGLLKAIEKESQEACGAWGDVAQPIYINKQYYEDSEFTIDITLDDGVTYTYYAFILKARYGQDIADEWPSKVFSPIERTESDANDFTTKATFSGWNGEYWLKYSRDQYREAQSTGTNANYTIKGNYQVVDENILYDPSFNNAYFADDLDANGVPYGEYFERGTQSRYLDFVAFWENGNGTSWSVPRQFHYYLWVEAPDQSDAAKVKAIAEAQQRVADGKQVALYVKNYGDYDDYLPHSDTEFKLAEEGVTTAIIGDTLYILYDKVDACDNSLNPAKQTVPGVAGYTYAGSEVEDTKHDNTNGYSSYSAAMAADKYYYQNDGFDSTLYKNSYTLNFAYKANPCSITLRSWNHIKTLGEKEGIVYNSMVGANLITGKYANDPKYGNDPGYMYESMMENYYPSDLPEGAYYFAGWYKTADYIPGTEANFDKPMPNYNMMLYAKWEPRRFDVEVYQTSDRDALVYYPLSKTENGPMQSLVQKETVKIHGEAVEVGKAGTGKGYGEYLPNVVPLAGPDKTGTEVEGQWIPTIPENCSPLDYANGTGTIRMDWIFVCYAYMKDGVEHAIDVSSYTITEDVQIYAKWTATEILDYRVEYVVADLEVTLDDDGNEILKAKRHETNADGTPCYVDGKLVYKMVDSQPVYEQVTFQGNELVFADGVAWIPMPRTVMHEAEEIIHVADPVTGKVNEGANRTFYAKTGQELYEDFRIGYFPVYVNHTALMQQGAACTCCETPVITGTDENHPLITRFYYVPLNNVPYRVKYLDKFGNAVIDLDNDGEYRDDMEGLFVENTGADLKMVVTENYRYRENYVPDAFQKTLVLSANIDANVITFLYEHTDGKLPYTIQYYYETLGSVTDDTQNDKKYLLHHELSGVADEGALLKVDYLDITGFEYAMDLTTRFRTQDLSSFDTEKITTRGDKPNIVTNKAELELEDLRGHKVTVKAQEGAVVYENTDGHAHDLTNSIFTYTQEGVVYRVKAIRNVSGNLVIDGYADPAGSMSVEQGDFGTVVKVYYDLKQYPYYIIHKVDGGPELDVTFGFAKFQSVIGGKAMSDTALIEHTPSYAGYAAKDSDKHITVTMTIQDDGSTPHINTITFLYYEKMMEFDYVPMLLKNPGMEGSDALVVAMPENEPNAQINLVRDYIKSATGTADAAHPVIYEDAYEFLGWFLDEACTMPVANSEAAVYLGTGYTQDENGVSSLEEPLSGRSNMTQAEYKLYDTLLPKKKVENYRYIDSQGELQVMDLTDGGVYVGAFNGKAYDQQETFYALFAPKLGSLTITRQNLGANFHNEANSFIYSIQGSNGFAMQVALGPEDFVADNMEQTSASVVITNLPLGEYTVTQIKDWSWRYTEESYSVSFTGTSLFQTATFEGDRAAGSWLSGFANVLKNVFGIT